MRPHHLGCVAWICCGLAAGCMSPSETCRHWDKEHDTRDRDSCRKACDEARDAFGCSQAASAMYLGEQGPKDFDEALRYSRKACEIDPTECGSVRFHECKADPKLCQERCLAKDPDSCAWQGRAHLSTDERAGFDREEALVCFRRACEADERFCGEGVEMACGKDPNGRLVACEEGNASSCYWTSVVFRRGWLTILRDRERAQRYLEQACRLNPTLAGLEERCAALKPAPLPAEQPVVPVPP
jgi:hypothetical protein